MGVVYFDKPSDPANPGPQPISTLPKHATMQTRLTRIGTDIVNVEMVTDDGVASQHNIKICRILVRYKDYVDVCSNIRQLSHRSCHGIRMVFMRKSDSGSRSVGRA